MKPGPARRVDPEPDQPGAKIRPGLRKNMKRKISADPAKPGCNSLILVFLLKQHCFDFNFFFDLVDLVTRLKFGIQILNRAEFKNYEIKVAYAISSRVIYKLFFFFFNKIQIVARYIQIQKKPMNILKKKRTNKI